MRSRLAFLATFMIESPPAQQLAPSDTRQQAGDTDSVLPDEITAEGTQPAGQKQEDFHSQTVLLFRCVEAML
jgi:hypothetical protein